VIPLSPEVKGDVDRILEAIIYLYTEGRRVTKEFARRANLTGPQLTVIKMLEQIGDLSLSELSDRIRAQNSTVTGIIDRMEREGLVVRERSTSDRRVVHIKLTDKGERIAAEIPVEPMEIFRGALESLSPQETRELLKISTKLANQVQTLVGPGMNGETKE
jgi:DNA-binding MarR family transcriptional regulator